MKKLIFTVTAMLMLTTLFTYGQITIIRPPRPQKVEPLAHEPFEAHIVKVIDGKLYSHKLYQRHVYYQYESNFPSHSYGDYVSCYINLELPEVLGDYYKNGKQSKLDSTIIAILTNKLDETPDTYNRAISLLTSVEGGKKVNSIPYEYFSTHESHSASFHLNHLTSDFVSYFVNDSYHLNYDLKHDRVVSIYNGFNDGVMKPIMEKLAADTSVWNHADSRFKQRAWLPEDFEIYAGGVIFYYPPHTVVDSFNDYGVSLQFSKEEIKPYMNDWLWEIAFNSDTEQDPNTDSDLLFNTISDDFTIDYYMFSARLEYPVRGSDKLLVNVQNWINRNFRNLGQRYKPEIMLYNDNMSDAQALLKYYTSHIRHANESENDSWYFGDFDIKKTFENTYLISFDCSWTVMRADREQENPCATFLKSTGKRLKPADLFTANGWEQAKQELWRYKDPGCIGWGWQFVDRHPRVTEIDFNNIDIAITDKVVTLFVRDNYYGNGIVCCPLKRVQRWLRPEAKKWLGL